MKFSDDNVKNCSAFFEKNANYVNFGEDDQMKIYGHKKTRLRNCATWFLTIITGGIIQLLFYWLPRLKLRVTHSKCSLDNADTVFLVEEFQKKHINYYVEKVECIRAENISKAHNRSKTSLTTADINFIKVEDQGKPKFSIHFGGRSFESVEFVKTFTCKKLTYILDPETHEFTRLGGLDKDIHLTDFYELPAITAYEQYMRRSVYGDNEILVPVKNIVTLFLKELSSPFYIFQLFSFCLWIADVYMYYAIVILAMTFVSISIDVCQTRKNQNNLRSTVSSLDKVSVLRDKGRGKISTILAKHLVPGDIITLSPQSCQMPCDAVLITGNCVINESMLTGESVPVTKTPLPLTKKIYDPKEHARHTLFCGTKVLQIKNIDSEKVLAVVIRTGYSTSKGSLIRSIMYPPPVDFKFEKDSYKFVAFLSLIAGFGVVYTIISKSLRGVPGLYIAMEALDLITVVVPPALPAAMTIGRFIAHGRLIKKKIFCTSPRSINVSGSTDCVCFDKTGTLTEDGLDIWGIVPSSKSFKNPIRNIEQMPLNDIMMCMASCHGITKIKDELMGDPLDLKMFESTGWILEEPNDSKTYLTSVTPPWKKTLKQDLEFQILRQFPFMSSLQRMSVIGKVSGADHYDVYCKGSPEVISSLSKPNTVPSDFETILEKYTSEGYRVIALSHKSLQCLPQSKLQRISRDAIENDLDFLGFLVLENRLKPETNKVIESLNNANIKVMMVTGDNMLTALSVAKSCRIIKPDTPVVTVDAILDKNLEKPEIHFTRNDTSLYGNPSDRYVFSVSGKTWALVKEHLPELLPRLVTRGAVFARMSPDQKQQLVLELRLLGYYVAMVGDGANDCGALKSAHLGISLSDTESSIAAPFTSRENNINCVLTVIREGRAALVTSFGIFKYMAAYSLTQFISVILLYEIEANLTDFQFLYIDLFIISVLAFFFGKTRAHDGPLFKMAPLTSLISLTPILSLLTQLVIVALVQYSSLYQARSSEWFVPFKSSEHKRGAGCYENYTIFVVSCYQYVILAIVFSKGRPYRKSLCSNTGLVLSCVLLVLFSSYLAIAPCDSLTKLFKLVVPPDMWFRLVLVGFGVGNFVVAIVVEKLFIEYFIFKRVRSMWKNMDRTKKKYLKVERDIENNCEL